MNTDIILLLSAVGGLALILASFVYFQRKLSKAPEAASPTESSAAPAGQDASGTRRNLRNRRRGMRNRGRRNNAEEAVEPQGSGEVGEGEGGEGDADAYSFEGMTEKQMKKALKKKEKKEQREALEANRQAAEEKREKKNQKYEEARALKEEERQERERLAQERAIEEQKKSKEEYDKWKDMFAVEQQGSTVNEDVDESVDLLKNFILHIKTQKVVMMEELAAEFNLRIQETMNRLEALEAMGRVTGVFDDRGKFIYISPEELRAVADFITKKGRISISELAKESNKLIDLSVAEAKVEVEPST